MRWLGPLFLVVAYFLLGCGAHVWVSLPNGHTLTVAHADNVAIVNDDTYEQVVKSTVVSLDTNDRYVFGEWEDIQGSGGTGYFVLDTTTSQAEYYLTKYDWELSLQSIGIAEIDLRDPSAFFNVEKQLWWRFALLALFVVVVIVSIWLWRRSSKKADALRELHSQPGF